MGTNRDEQSLFLLFDPEYPSRTIDEAAIAAHMSHAWIAFAKTGTPSHDAIPEWRPYQLDDRKTMLIDRIWQMDDDP
jgi:carboxylesterase type B